MVCQKSAPRTCTWSRFSKAADRGKFFNSPRAKAGSRIFNPKGIDMASVNKPIIVGYLGRDPEMRTFPSGDQVATVSIATTDRWKDKHTNQLKKPTHSPPPETRPFPSGDQVPPVSIAPPDRWKDKQTDQLKEATEWHRAVFNGRLAEIAGQYLRKGAQVYVEGSLRTRKWTDKDGVDRYSTEIRADQMKMLGSRDHGASPAGSPAGPADNGSKYPSQHGKSSESNEMQAVAATHSFQ